MDTKYPKLSRPQRRLNFQPNKKSSKQWAGKMTLEDVSKLFDDLDSDSSSDGCEFLMLSPKSETTSGAKEKEVEKKASPVNQQDQLTGNDLQTQMCLKGDFELPEEPLENAKQNLEMNLLFTEHGPIQTSSPLEGKVDMVKEADKKVRPVSPILFVIDDVVPEETNGARIHNIQASHSSDGWNDSPPKTLCLRKPMKTSGVGIADRREPVLVKEKTPQKLQTPSLESQRKAPVSDYSEPQVSALTQEPLQSAPVEPSQPPAARTNRTDVTAFLQRLRDTGLDKSAGLRKSPSPVNVPSPPPEQEPEEDFLILEEDSPVWLTIPRKKEHRSGKYRQEQGKPSNLNAQSSPDQRAKNGQSEKVGETSTIKSDSSEDKRAKPTKAKKKGAKSVQVRGRNESQPTEARDTSPSIETGESQPSEAGDRSPSRETMKGKSNRKPMKAKRKGAKEKVGETSTIKADSSEDKRAKPTKAKKKGAKSLQGRGRDESQPSEDGDTSPSIETGESQPSEAGDRSPSRETMKGKSNRKPTKAKRKGANEKVGETSTIKADSEDKRAKPTKAKKKGAKLVQGRGRDESQPSEDGDRSPSRETGESQPSEAGDRSPSRETMKGKSNRKPTKAKRKVAKEKVGETFTIKADSSEHQRAKTTKTKKKGAKSLQGRGRDESQPSEDGDTSPSSETKMSKSNSKEDVEHLTTDTAKQKGQWKVPSKNSETLKAKSVTTASSDEASPPKTSQALGKRIRKRPVEWWLNVPSHTEQTEELDGPPALKESRQDPVKPKAAEPGKNVPKERKKRSSATARQRDKRKARKTTDWLRATEEASKTDGEDKAGVAEESEPQKRQSIDSEPLNLSNTLERLAAPGHIMVFDQHIPKYKAALVPLQKKRTVPSSPKRRRSLPLRAPTDGKAAVSTLPPGVIDDGETLRKRKPRSAAKTLEQRLATLQGIFNATTEVSPSDTVEKAAHKNTAKKRGRIHLFPAPQEQSTVQSVIVDSDTVDNNRTDGSDGPSILMQASNERKKKLSWPSSIGFPQGRRRLADSTLKGFQSGPTSMFEVEHHEEHEDIFPPSTRLDSSVCSSLGFCSGPLVPLALQAEDKTNLTEWLSLLWPANIQTEKILNHFKWFSYRGRAIGLQVDNLCDSMCNGKILLGSYMKKPLWVDHCALTVYYVSTSAVGLTLDVTNSPYYAGQSFIVPCGHAYSIENLGEEPAMLFFSMVQGESPD